MEMATFAIENGYAEAVIRGFRASFFSNAVYEQIKNCQSLDDLVSVKTWMILDPERNRLWTLPVRQRQHEDFGAHYQTETEKKISWRN